MPSVSMRQLERVVHDALWKGLASLDHRIELDANASKDAIEVVWSAPEDAFQLSPSLTGLTMNLQGLASGHGTATFDKRGWTWAVEQAQIAGTGWRLEGAAPPCQRQELNWTAPFIWMPPPPRGLDSKCAAECGIHPACVGKLTAEGTMAIRRPTTSQIGARPAPTRGTCRQARRPTVQVDAPAVHFGSETFSADSISCQWAGNPPIWTSPTSPGPHG